MRSDKFASVMYKWYSLVAEVRTILSPQVAIG
jgi:hypothetical protein